MNLTSITNRTKDGHRIILMVVLCLFGLCLVQSAPRKKQRVKSDDRVYLMHADELKYDQFSANPAPQIVKGHVSFKHQGGILHCDSAYFFQESNSVSAFGHVRYKQGDTLSLDCDRAYYDGPGQMMMARNHVVLRHHRQTLYTDSLDYDRLYNNAYFFEGGTLIDGKDKLVSDWGEYNTDTREAVFYYNVQMRNGDRLITTDTLYYDTRQSLAHVVGPSQITQGSSVIDTELGYFNTKTDQAQLFGRSTVVDNQKTITGDSLFYDKTTGIVNGYGNVIYVDKENKNSLTCDLMFYNEQTGYGFATKNPVAKDYSQKDTLYVHADTMKLYTFNINTDSVYRKAHIYNKVRAYRTDVQAVCDSLVFSSLDSCMTMYRDPIVWSDNRQLLGEEIRVYMNDSTVRLANVIGQASSIELMFDNVHYNQISSKVMNAYFQDGNIRKNEAIGNVQTVFYPIEDKDSSFYGLNYLETDTMRMYLSSERKLEKIWASKSEAVMYPMTQIPPMKDKLSNFAWFDYIRPKDKDDIYEWRGKAAGTELKVIERHEVPLQRLGNQEKKEEEEPHE